MRSYTQLTQEQRYQISALRHTHQTQVTIAGILGVHPSTISPEIRRNCGQRGYRPEQAHRWALQRRQTKSAPRIASQTWGAIEARLQAD